MLTKETFKISFVIPHINFVGLRKTLTTIRENLYSHNVGKVILIDQNPSGYQDVDDLVDIHVRTKNLHFAKACNMGMKLANDSRFICCLNDDCEMIHPKAIEGIVETFNRYNTAVGVNFGSPRNPSYSGGPPVDHKDFPYKEKWTEEDYDKLVNEIFNGWIYDGICTFGTVFDMEKLNKVVGVIPDKCWFDERFQISGGEDMDLNLRAYVSGFRMLGSELAGCYHFWYSSKREGEDKCGVKYDGDTLDKKWVKEFNGRIIKPNIFSDYEYNDTKEKVYVNGELLKVKIEDVPQNIIRE